jgi:peptidoglycan hydrolase-like protein with peptidoglycan-binding domain
VRRVALIGLLLGFVVPATATTAAAAAHAPAPLAFTPAAPVIGSDGAVLAISASDINTTFDAAFSGSSWVVNGTVSVYVPGQTVTLAVYLRGTAQTSVTVPIEPATNGGTFSTPLSVDGAGAVTVQATHAVSAGQELLVSAPLQVSLVSTQIAPGQRGLAVRILQSELSRGHFVVGVPGLYDARTQRAVLAFRKLADLQRTSVVNAGLFAALAAGKGKFVVRYRGQGRHVEGDLTHQVLALIGANNKVERLYPMSSGKPSTPTQPGEFHVWLRVPGTNSDGMVNSSFFNGGDAIHGYAEVPPYNASHGCLRVPIPDSLSIYDWVGGTGVPVDVYFR